jgi:glycosyltransferase involved in cell wall biosynthesis
MQATNALPTVSIVIANYNYADFLGAAIDSALALDWPAVEVIVVDDGSTDGSRELIERYGARITPIFFQPNRGQRAAYNAGFAKSRGDIVIFLDSDDMLDRSLVRKIAPAFGPGVSKVQVQMRIIDAHGDDQGIVLPQYYVLPTGAAIKGWMTATADYPTPPGSGNAYARSFLERIFPLEGSDRAADSYCVAAAPYLGSVVTIPEPLVSYRVHGRNMGAMSSLERSRFNTEVARAIARFRYAKNIAESVGVTLPEHALHRGLRFLPYRLASLRLARDGHPIDGDSRGKLLVDALLAVLEPQGFSVPSSAALLSWLALTAALPLPLAERLILWRFVSSSRPRVLKTALRRLGIVARRSGAGPVAATSMPCA